MAASISRQRMKAESALLQVETPQLFGVARWGDGEPMVIMGLPFGKWWFTIGKWWFTIMVKLPFSYGKSPCSYG